MVAPWTSLDGGGGDSTHLRAVWTRLARRRHVHLVARTREKHPGVSSLIAPAVPFLESAASLTHARIALHGVFRAFHPQVVYERNHAFGVGVQAAIKRGIPSVVEVNGSLTQELRLLGTSDAILRRMVRRERETLHTTDAIIAVSATVADAMIALHELPAAKLRVIENGVDLAAFTPGAADRPAFGLPPDQFLLAFVGNLSPWSGMAELLDGLSHLPADEAKRLTLVVAGEGTELTRIQESATRLGLDVRFLGHVPHARVPSLLRSVDGCVAFKGPAPGSPTKVKEYLACGKPVLVSASADFEYVGRNRMGLLVEPREPDKVAESILTLMRNDRERAAMGNRGVSWALEHASWDGVATETLQLIDSLPAATNERRGHA